MSFPEGIPFEVVSEKWSSYDLGEGITLKTKLVLVKILKPPNVPLESVSELVFNAPVFTAIYAPPEKKGTPETKELTAELLQTSIVEEVDPKPIEENVNEYTLEGGGMIRLRLMLTRVGLTDLFSADGSPVVAVQHQVVPLMRFPRSKRRRSSSKKPKGVV